MVFVCSYYNYWMYYCCYYHVTFDYYYYYFFFLNVLMNWWSSVILIGYLLRKKHFELIVIGYDLFWPELKIRVMWSNKGKKTNFFTFLWYNTWENFISVTKLISYCSIDNLLYQMWQKSNKVVRDLVRPRELQLSICRKQDNRDTRWGILIM